MAGRADKRASSDLQRLESRIGDSSLHPQPILGNMI